MSVLISSSSPDVLVTNGPFVELSCAGGFFNLSQPYTIIAHVARLSSSSGGVANRTYYWSVGDSSGTHYDSVATVGSPRVWEVFTDGTATPSVLNGFVDDQGYYVALRRTSSTALELWVNDTLVATNTGTQVSTTADVIRLAGTLAGGANNGSAGNIVILDCIRIYDAALSPAEIVTEGLTRRAARTTNLLCDIAVCAPGDFLSYNGSKSQSLVFELDNLARNPTGSIDSYSDLVPGPLTGSPPTEEPIIDFFGADNLVVINGLSDNDMTVDAEYIYSRWKEWVANGNAQFLPAFRTIGGDPIGGGVEVGAYFFLRNDLGWRIQAKGHTHELTVTGNLYPESSNLPMFELPGDAFPTSTLIKQQLSSLTQGITVTTGGGGGGGSSSVYIGDTPPANPIPGDLWWNSSTGLMMIYYNDGNSSQWVIANPTSGGSCPTAEEIRIEMDTNSTKLQDIYTNTQNIIVTVDNIENILLTSFPTLGNIADAVWSAALNQYAGGSPASAGFIVSTILNEVIDVHDDTTYVRPIIDNIMIHVDEILKYDRNRTRIDKVAKTLTVYDDDEVTPIRVFNLLDGTGTPSVTEVLERDPI